MMPYRLPLNLHRCDAWWPDSCCRQCLRWIDLPLHTCGESTPLITRSNSQDEGCSYIPINAEILAALQPGARKDE